MSSKASNFIHPEKRRTKLSNLRETLFHELLDAERLLALL